MTETEKRTICKSFKAGISVEGMVRFRWMRKKETVIFNAKEVEAAIRWGLKHPNELKPGNER